MFHKKLGISRPGEQGNLCSMEYVMWISDSIFFRKCSVTAKLIKSEEQKCLCGEYNKFYRIC
jgi:hypothetical protein